MSIEVPSRAQLRIEEAVSSWATNTIPVDKEKDKEKKKDKEKEKDKEEEKLPQKKIQSAVIEWSGGAVKDLKDIKKEAKKKEKEEKRLREAQKKREKEEKRKDEKKRKETLGLESPSPTTDQQQNLTIEGLSLATTTPQQSMKSRRLIPFFRPKEASTPTNTSPTQSPTTSQSLSHLSPTTEEDENIPVPLRLQAMKNLLNFLEKINAVESEGVFRIPGNTSVVKKIWRSLAQDPPPDFSDVDEVSSSSHDYAGALKLYLREAPESIIPDGCTGKFLEALKTQDPLLRLFGIIEALQELPKENQAMIRDICCFLKKINENSQKTKMDVKNIAIAFGPSFFPGQKASFDIKMIGLFCEVVTILISNSDEIFAQMDMNDADEEEQRAKSTPTSIRSGDLAVISLSNIQSSASDETLTTRSRNQNPAPKPDPSSVSEPQNIDSDTTAATTGSASLSRRTGKKITMGSRVMRDGSPEDASGENLSPDSSRKDEA